MHAPAALFLAAILALPVIRAAPVQGARALLPLPAGDSARLAHADSLMRAGRLPEMFQALEQVARDADREGNRLLAMRARLARGVRLAFGGRDREAEPVLRQAIAGAIATNDSVAEVHAHSWLAAALQGEGRLAESRRENERTLSLALVLGEHSREAYALVGLGYCDVQAGDFPRARERYSTAVLLMRAMRDSHGECTALIGLGRSASGLGDVPAARAWFLAADSLARMAGLPGQRAHALNNLATLEVDDGRFTSGAAAYRRSIELHRAAGNLREAVTPAGNLASLLSLLGRTDEACAMLDSLRSDCVARGARDLEVMVLVDLAYAHLQARRPHEAIASLEPILRSSGEVPLQARANATGEFGAACIQLDSLPAGILAIRQFLREHRKSLGAGQEETLRERLCELLLAGGRYDELRHESGRTLRLARSRGSPIGIANALTLSGCAWLHLGRPLHARRDLSEASPLWTRGRAGPLVEGSMLGIVGPATCAVALALAELSLPSHDGRDSLERAFAALQGYRSRALLRRVRLGPGRGDRDRALSLRELQAHVLEPGELLLDCYVSPDSTLLFAIRREDVRVLRLPRRDALRRALSPLHDLLTIPARLSGVSEADLDAARLPVERLVLAPLSAAIEAARSVTFCPDDAMHDLPLEALRGPDGRPLGLTTPISRAPSAAILAELRRRPDPADRELRVAVVDLPMARGETQLPGVEREIDRLVRSFQGTRRIRTDRVSDVVGAFRICDVLHLTGHADVDTQRPWRSGLRLGRAAGPDLSLTAAAVAGTHSAARLVVLSGCGTAEGRRVLGEGVDGLASAFLIAGAPTVVATHWPVDDAASAELVSGFYDGLARGESVAHALVSGRNRVAARPETRPPFYWAGFVAEGDGSRGVPLRVRGRLW